MWDRVQTGISGAWRYTRSRLGRIAVVAALFVVLGAGMFAVRPRAHEPSAVGLEMAGDRATFGRVLAGGGPSIAGDPARPATPFTCRARFATDQDCVRAAHLARRALLRDLLFIGAYVIWALGLCLLGAWSAMRERTRTLLYACAWAAGIAGVADLAENAFLARALHSGASGNWTRVATVAATTKWSLVPVFVAGAVVGLCTYVRRAASARNTGTTALPLDRVGRWEPPADGAWDFDQRGICFSGGGIRSAAFCLGVMQQLETGDGENGSALAKTRYLAAVSGGGYVAGAAQLHASLDQARRVAAARAGAGNEGPDADVAEALITAQAAPPTFRPGSAEEDHLRRHGNYLADSAGEWFTAIAQALGKLLANLALTGLAIVALSQPLGWIGRLLLGAKPSAVMPRGNWPHFPMTANVALALLGLPALFLAAGRRHARVVGTPAARAPVAPTLTRETTGRGLFTGIPTKLAIALGAGAGILATTAFVLPLLNGLGRQIAGLIGHPRGVTAAVWPTVVLTAVLGRVVTKALKRETTGGAAPADPKAAGAAKKGRPNLFFAKNLVELVAGPVIVLVLIGYLTALATQARENGPVGVLRTLGSLPIRDWHVAAVAAGAFAAVFFTVDAVNWSLHRFYKRRLWSAFTYDAGRLDERDWSTETKISKHGKPLPGRPELVLCAAAQVSGPGVAPPGHRAVTWTFDHEWVGGPEIGWCPTETMETTLAEHGRGGDVSMFGAIAIAGAAFGSAMGRHSKGSLNSVLALSNARLGVWLPNPAQLRGGTWRYWPHTLTYLAREIFGRYAPKGRWMLVADGGHYENLGLVELLRRRCTRIVCIDASGDASGAVTTVAEALRVAEQELGVIVTVPAAAEVDSPWDVAPGSGELSGSTGALADAFRSRLARRPIVRATITYPPEAGLGATTGQLIVGRSVLDPNAPWPVLSYAAGNDAFPNDPTGDQWFDADQFDNYVILGRNLATNLLPEMDSIGWFD